MHSTGERYRDIATSLLGRPDEVMLEVGASGEDTWAASQDDCPDLLIDVQGLDRGRE